MPDRGAEHQAWVVRVESRPLPSALTMSGCDERLRRRWTEAVGVIIAQQAGNAKTMKVRKVQLSDLTESQAHKLRLLKAAPRGPDDDP